MKCSHWNLVALLFVAVTSARADVNGSISGIIKDPTGAVVPRAEVSVIDMATEVTRTSATDNSGAYAFLSLPVGRYRLNVKADGFQRYQQTGILLDTNDELHIDVVLKVGEVSQSVEVAADPVHVETANTQLGDVISGSHMESMPLNGRMFTDLLGLQAGVVPQISPQGSSYGNFFGSTQQGNVSISGQRETSNGFLVNGATVDNAANNGATVVPNLDSIGEFRVLTANFDAEHGNYSGGLITVVTKSGTNEFHGSAFDYLRNTDLDARSFFDISRTAFQQNQFGGTVGGPIRRNKVFFFMDYQGTRNNIGQGTGQIPVPSPAERTGDFSASADSLTGTTVGGTYWASLLSKELGYTVSNGEPYYTPGCTNSANCVFPNAIIPQAAFSAPAKALMQYIPLPNLGSTFVSSANVFHTQDDLGSGRVDINSNRFGTISGYYFIDQVSTFKPFGTNNTPGFPTQDGGRSQLYTISDIKTFNPTTLNELNLAYNRHVFHNNQPLKGFGTLASLGFNENQPGGIVNAAGSLEGVPTFFFNNYGIGLPGVNFNRYENMPSVSDNFSKVIGKHTLKMGGKYSFNDFYEPMPLVGGNGFIGFFGTETGSDFADFLIGAPTFFIQEGGFNVDNRRNYVGLYGQDSWRVKPNLTLNYGLRWDVIQPWYEKRDQASTFVLGAQSTVHQGAPQGYVFPGDNVPGYGKIPRTIAPTRYKGFAPRFGFAYAPSASGGFLAKLLGGPDKSSIRGGIGIFYNNTEGALEIDETGLAPFDIFYQSPLPPLFASPYTNRLDGGIHQPFPFDTQNFNWPLALPLAGYPVPPIDQKVPYTVSYNLTLQRQFGVGTLLSLGYIGNQSHHLLTQIQNNPGNPQLCLSLSEASQVAPGSPTCGPFLESAVFTRADGTIVNGTRQPFGSNFVDNYLFATVGNSAYNSLQTSLRHTSGRLTFQLAYTFSKSLDNSSNLQDKKPNPYNTRLSRGLSSFDITHNFVASYSYLLPFDLLTHNRATRLTAGWKLVGITHFATGFPIVMFETDDHSLLGDGQGPPQNTDTPDFLGGSLHFTDPRKANVSTGLPYFNTALFAPSAIGHVGTANKAFFHGPGLNNFDMSLLKDVKLAERSKLEFRFEFFNIFNHAQFYNPGGNITAGPTSFGMINSARAGRIGQVAIKLLF